MPSSNDCARFPLISVRIVVFLGILAIVSRANAQDRPFQFSLSAAPRVPPSPQTRVDYDIGLGEQTFHSDTSNAPEQRIGLQASIGRWTLVGRLGVSMVHEAYNSSQSGEALYSISLAASSPVALAIGGGVLHEPNGTNVWLTRVVAAHDAERWRLDGNVLLQMPRAVGRDAVDVITTVGWSHRITPAVALGFEVLGEDVEGFWNAAEAEGGARLLAGPSLHIRPSGRRWQISATGGPTFHPSSSPLISSALRTLPARSQGGGYAVRTSFALSF